MQEYLMNIHIKRKYSELDIFIKLIQDINGLQINIVLIVNHKSSTLT